MLFSFAHCRSRARDLALITADFRARGISDAAISGPDFLDIRRAIADLAQTGVVGTSPDAPYSVDGDPPQTARYAATTTDFFSVLETPVVLGRTFIADDIPHQPSRDSAGAVIANPRQGPRAAIIGYEYWQRRFHGDSHVVGREIVGPWGPTRIIGVASPFAQLFFPAEMRAAHAPDIWEARGNFVAGSRRAVTWRVVARLNPGTSIDVVRRRLDSLAVVLAEQYPEVHGANGTVFRIEPMHDYLVRGVRPALSALAGAAIVVLLIACANVGNLLLLRGAARERELAIRAAIGGTSSRIVRQLLAESLILSAIASMIGVGIASFLLALLRHANIGDLPRADDISINGRVLSFAVISALGTPMLFGLVPALHAVRSRIASALQRAGHSSSLGAVSRLRSTVVVAEVSLSFVLLIGCGLLARTFINLAGTELGFDPRNVVTFTISNRNFSRAEDRNAFVHAVHDRVAGIPGADGVTISSSLPFSNEGTSAPYGTERMLLSPSRVVGQADLRAVLPGYFDVLRIGVLAGRAFTAADDSADQKFVIVDDAIATAAFGGEPAVGKTIVTSLLGRANQAFTIIGVVHRERHKSLFGDEHSTIYFPWVALSLEYGRWAVRTSARPAVIEPAIRDAIQTLPVTYQSNTRTGGVNARRLIVNPIEPLIAFVDRAMGPTRFVVAAVSVFAVVATLMTTIGLYSVLASSVQQRTAEIGVRLAFGALQRDIFTLVIKDALRLITIGLSAGVLLSLASTRVIIGLLVGVRPTDATTYVVMTVGFLAVTLVATIVPARRAASLDPTIALRVDAS